jgi:DNA-directed RNA polymerase specialized sigma24 family protein
VKKTTKAALAERIAENRRGNALSPEQDAELLKLYLAPARSGGKKPSYRSISADTGYSVGTVMRAIRRASEAS